MDHHILQVLHHGTTAVLWEPEVPADKSSYVYLRLERSCCVISWHRAGWKQLKSQQGKRFLVYRLICILMEFLRNLSRYFVSLILICLLLFVFCFDIDFNPTINPEESVAYHVSKHLLNYTDAESTYQTLEEVSCF